MTSDDHKAWGDHLRSRYGIAYAVDILTKAEEEEAENLEDHDDFTD